MIFSLRHFDGLKDEKSYVEFSQKMAQILGIHFIADTSTYCKLDESGDLISVAVINSNEQGHVCTLAKEALEFYMYLTDSTPVRFYEIDRYRDKAGLVGSGSDQTAYEYPDDGIYFKHLISKGASGAPFFSRVRGFQIIRSSASSRAIMAMLTGRKVRKKKYEKFTALDWKHGAVKVCSCDPSKLGNYFVQSDLPFETSPAFFKPEVLSKYKLDPDKYAIDSRHIRCRGVWSLPYDINQAGQVHAYLCDLGDLPSSEQTYWKSYNEKPKDGISDRAYKTDFLNQWSDTYDPLASLKRRLGRFPQPTHNGSAVDLVVRPSRNELNRLSDVVTSSAKEWQDQMLELAKVLVDGLKKDRVRGLARHLNCDDPQLGSIKLLRKVLESTGTAPDIISTIVDPLEELQRLRSSTSAHRGGSVPRGDLRLLYRRLVERLDRSMDELGRLVESGYLNVR